MQVAEDLCDGGPPGRTLRLLLSYEYTMLTAGRARKAKSFPVAPVALEQGPVKRILSAPGSEVSGEWLRSM
jgi:hypothetical protein